MSIKRDEKPINCRLASTSQLSAHAPNEPTIIQKEKI